eukprot:PhM_4_TR10183/c0_g1_i1/m.82245
MKNVFLFFSFNFPPYLLFFLKKQKPKRREPFFPFNSYLVLRHLRLAPATTHPAEHIAQEHPRVAWHKRNIPRRGQVHGNLLRCLDPTQLNQPLTGLGDGIANKLRGRGLTLGTHNSGLLLLLGLEHDELEALRLLLRHLLRLDGLHKLLAKGNVHQRDVIEDDVELSQRLLTHPGADAVGNHLTLHNKFLGVVFSNDGLHNLVADRRQHALVVVRAEVAPEVRERLLVGTEQHTKSDVDHLKIFCARDGGDDAGAQTHVEDLGGVHHRHAEMDSLRVNVVADAGEHRVDAGTLTGVHNVGTAVGSGSGDGHRAQ